MAFSSSNLQDIILGNQEHGLEQEDESFLESRNS